MTKGILAEKIEDLYSVYQDLKSEKIRVENVPLRVSSILPIGEEQPPQEPEVSDEEVGGWIKKTLSLLSKWIASPTWKFLRWTGSKGLAGGVKSFEISKDMLERADKWVEKWDNKRLAVRLFKYLRTAKDSRKGKLDLGELIKMGLDKTQMTNIHYVYRLYHDDEINEDETACFVLLVASGHCPEMQDTDEPLIDPARGRYYYVWWLFDSSDEFKAVQKAHKFPFRRPESAIDVEELDKKFPSITPNQDFADGECIGAFLGRGKVPFRRSFTTNVPLSSLPPDFTDSIPISGGKIIALGVAVDTSSEYTYNIFGKVKRISTKGEGELNYDSEKISYWKWIAWGQNPAEAAGEDSEGKGGRAPEEHQERDIKGIVIEANGNQGISGITVSAFACNDEILSEIASEISSNDIPTLSRVIVKLIASLMDGSKCKLINYATSSQDGTFEINIGDSEKLKNIIVFGKGNNEYAGGCHLFMNIGGYPNFMLSFGPDNNDYSIRVPMVPKQEGSERGGNEAEAPTPPAEPTTSTGTITGRVYYGVKIKDVNESNVEEMLLRDIIPSYPAKGAEVWVTTTVPKHKVSNVDITTNDDGNFTISNLPLDKNLLVYAKYTDDKKETYNGKHNDEGGFPLKSITLTADNSSAVALVHIKNPKPKVIKPKVIISPIVRLTIDAEVDKLVNSETDGKFKCEITEKIPKKIYISVFIAHKSDEDDFRIVHYHNESVFTIAHLEEETQLKSLKFTNDPKSRSPWNPSALAHKVTLHKRVTLGNTKINAPFNTLMISHKFVIPPSSGNNGIDYTKGECMLFAVAKSSHTQIDAELAKTLWQNSDTKKIIAITKAGIYDYNFIKLNVVLGEPKAEIVESGGEAK